jgi:hypothetical protein
VLFHFENLGYEEIAAKLKISLAKVKTDIFRGREALRKKLQLSIGNEDEWAEYTADLPSGPPQKPQLPKRNPARYTQALLA